MNNKDEIITVTQACSRYGVSRQTIFLCIKNNRLKAEKLNHKWMFTVGAWKEYLESKYHRKYSIREGKKMYDENEDRLSPSMIVKDFGIDKQRLYYLIRKGVISHQRIGPAYVISSKEILEKFDNFNKKPKKKQP